MSSADVTSVHVSNLDQREVTVFLAIKIFDFECIIKFDIYKYKIENKVA